jgi:plastocyanin
MERRTRFALGALFVIAAVGLVVPAVVVAGPGSTATTMFGNLKAGSPFPPAEHDSSFNGEDNIIPRTVVISAGGSVTFDIDGFHQAAVYEAGTTPGDISVPAFPPESNIFVNDPDGRRFLGPVGTASTTGPGTFATPGRYLMICNVTPHFAFAKMYGWVIVK